MMGASNPRRWLFTLTILTGSFLLFLVQPMIARMALPRLGGAPNVWNSAMLVYQALLLGGYAYAHAIGRLSLAKQGLVHLAVLLLAGLFLPLSLAQIAPPAPGWEALWVPWLFLLTVGPPFFAISAQAPLIQRWFAAHPDAGNPYPLYAASNLGSFAGLLTYPLLAEPFFGLSVQSLAWAAGYVLLFLLVVLTVLSRRDVRGVVVQEIDDQPAEKIGWKRTCLWLALAAVPSAFMLSTTTFLTTDIMAMPLLWVIPLGLYLLSYSVAFAEKRGLAGLFLDAAPITLLVLGSISVFAAGRSDLLAAFASAILLFVVAIALHARLYEDRPPPVQLTRFYLIMSAGGALGGAFTALVAPIAFDWTWEHPLLILAAAALLPLAGWRRLFDRVFSDPSRGRIALALGLFITFTGAIWMFDESRDAEQLGAFQWAGFAAIFLFALLLAARRWSFVAGCAALLAGLGGFASLQVTMEGKRERSYFGIYTIQEQDDGGALLLHGTTVHGVQRGGAQALAPTAYYGESSGIGLSLKAADAMLGANARIGIVGLGVGTLACYRQKGQDWTFFEIDPIVLDYSLDGQFTFMEDCAPDDEVVIGDARLELENLPAASFDLLAIDAFSSDAIPLHLLTAEALDIYWRSLEDDGLLLMHISNRYIDLEPVLARLAQSRGLHAIIRRDVSQDATLYSSNWVAFARQPEMLAELNEPGGWDQLKPASGRTWTDEYASILQYLRWSNFL